MICKPGEVQMFEPVEFDTTSRRLGPTLDTVGSCLAGVLNDLDDLEVALCTVLAPASPQPEAPARPQVDPPAVDTALRLLLAASDASARIADIRSRLRL